MKLILTLFIVILLHSVSEGNIVTLQDNFTMTSPVIIDKKFVLDLNQKVLMISIDEAVKVTASGDLTIKNGTVISSGRNIIYSNGGKITLGEDLTINSSRSVIYADSGGVVNISGADITCSDLFDSVAFITGSDSEINILNGSLKSTSLKPDVYTLIISDNASASISGGKVESVNGSAIMNNSSKNNLKINSGVINGRIAVSNSEIQISPGSDSKYFIRDKDGKIKAAVVSKTIIIKLKHSHSEEEQIISSDVLQNNFTDTSSEDTFIHEISEEKEEIAEDVNNEIENSDTVNDFTIITVQSKDVFIENSAMYTGSKGENKFDFIDDSSVTVLNLRDSEVEDVNVKGLKNLKIVYVSGNKYIKSLNLSETSITELSVEGCENLEELDVSSTDITFLNLKSCYNLQNLNIEGCENIQSVEGLEDTALNGGCNVFMQKFYIFFIAVLLLRSCFQKSSNRELLKKLKNTPD